MRITLARLESPLGRITFALAGGRLAALELGDADGHLRERLRRDSPGSVLEEGAGAPEVRARLEGYFAGELRAFDALEVTTAGTPFEEQVWRALRRIPAGATWSYRDLAAAIGRPTAVRAVGAANGRNRIALVIPCHRVIASTGALGGYAGGLDRKAWLLRHEGALPRDLFAGHSAAAARMFGGEVPHAEARSRRAERAGERSSERPDDEEGPDRA